jgi:hypothetical protein
MFMHMQWLAHILFTITSGLPLQNIQQHLDTDEEKGAKLMQVNAVDGSRRTPFHLACSHGNFIAVKELCKHGAHASEEALLAAVGSRDGYSRAAIVRFLLDSTRLAATIHGDRASAIADESLLKGPSHAAALILHRQRAKGTSVQVPDKSWLAAAEHVSDNDPLLQFFPLNSSATAEALGKAWQTRKQQQSSTQGAFDDDGQDTGRNQQLAESTASELLKRVCKGDFHARYRPLAPLYADNCYSALTFATHQRISSDP